MLYLLDANVLIDANRDYYPQARVPEFWDWLVSRGINGDIKIPIEVHDEIKGGGDQLAMWSKDKDVKAALLLGENALPQLVDKAVRIGYAADITEDELEALGRDPFLVAYGLRSPGSRCIVTTEVSKPSRQRSNRHIPDVCRDFGINTATTFQLIRDLDFQTGWNN